jgi:hypothetical protein
MERIADQFKRMVPEERPLGELPPQERSNVTAMIIRNCLRGKAAAQMRYADENGSHIGGSLAAPAPPRLLRAAAVPGRNDPCPCGSGKKYKKCCGR